MKSFFFSVVYLANYNEGISSFKKFLKYYYIYKPGIKHELIICFKNFLIKNNVKSWKKIVNQNIKYKTFVDEYKIDDYDWGSYRRIAKKNKKKIILFLNSHSYPIKNNWLQLITKHYTKKSLIGCTASYASLSSSFFSSFKYYKINFLKSLIYGFCNLFRFPIFPNPHIRSNAFLIKGSDFLSLKLPDLFSHKLQTNISESGWAGMTRQLKKIKFKIILANSKGQSYLEPNWIESEVFSYKNQKNLIVSDNRTRIYKSLSLKDKRIEQKFHWGI
jgi:hypothetical protein